MLEQEYKEFMSGIGPVPEVRERVLEQMLADGRKVPSGRARSLRRVLVTAVCCLLVAALSITVAAAAFPGFRAWLFGPDSGFADSMEPLDIVSEDQGIRMEVIGAAVSGDTAVAYFTLQDISGENRLDETTMVGVKSRRAAEYQREAREQDELDQAGTRCTLMDFDPDTCTALMRFQLTAARDISQKPLDFTVSLITAKTFKRFYAVPLSEELLTEETLPIGGRAYYQEQGGKLKIAGYTELEDSGISENDFTSYFVDETGVPVVLKPRSEPLALPDTELAAISAVGYVNGNLRVQVVGSDTLLAHENGRMRAELLPKDCDLIRMAEDEAYAAEMADRVPWLYHNTVGSFGIPEDFGKPALGILFFQEARYDEEAYDIPREELEQYQIGASVYYEGIRLTGAWTAELSGLSELEERLVTLEKLELPSGTVNSLEISTLGLFVESTVGVLKDVSTVTVYCGDEAVEYQMVTGSTGLFAFETRDDPDYPVTAKYAAKRPVDPGKVTAVEIGGERIELPK